MFVHPTIPLGGKDMRLDEFSLATPVGFMVDTTLSFTRLILSGFLDRYPNVKLIAPHGGGTLPYLSGRLDRCYETIPACRAAIKEQPSDYLRRIFYDTVVYEPRALAMCVAVGGADNVLYGTDFPHNVGDMKGILALVRDLPGDQAGKGRGRKREADFRNLVSRTRTRGHDALNCTAVAAAAGSLGAARVNTLSADRAAYPTRTIKLVVGFGAGGGVDIVARLVAQKMQESCSARTSSSRTGRAATRCSVPTRRRSRRPMATRCSTPRPARCR